MKWITKNDLLQVANVIQQHFDREFNHLRLNTTSFDNGAETRILNSIHTHFSSIFKEQTLMQAEIQTVLDNVNALEDKVDAVATQFTAQQQAISDLNTQIAGLGLSDADKATLQAAADKATAETTKLGDLLNPPTPGS